MVKSFVPPKPGKEILLMCMDCKESFSGPNPGYGILKKRPILRILKPKCPNCGSKNVIPNPGVRY